MSHYDDLIREGRDTDALRLFAREYYESGKMGHTRLQNAIRVADRCDTLEADNERLKREQKQEIRERYISASQMGGQSSVRSVSLKVVPLLLAHIAQLEAELAELREENEANEAYIVGLNATIDLCLKRFHNINNKAVEFHEMGPHDEKESLRRVMEIYDMSLLPKGTDNEVD